MVADPGLLAGWRLAAAARGRGRRGEYEYEDENEGAGTPPCPGAGTRNPLDLCARWSGLSLRDPHCDYGDEEEYEE
jgi:hypothetical protein